MPLLKTHHPIRHIKSVKYASDGLLHAIVNEANFRIQLLLVVFFIMMGVHFKISTIEWGLVILTSGALVSAEMINTVIEEFIDHLIKEHHEGARVIKDLAAGAVLTTAITCGVVIVMVFGPRILALF